MIQAGDTKQRDPEMEAIMKKGFRSVNTMLTADPPRQRRYRSLCQKPFSASNVAKLQPYIESLAHELIDDFIDQGECDWMEPLRCQCPFE